MLAVSVTKTNRLILDKEVVTIYPESFKKCMDTLCGYNTEIF